jgi:hypothetical protein
MIRQQIHAWRLSALGLVALFCLVTTTACGSDDKKSSSDAESCTVDTSYDPVIDPASFVSGVDNPLYPLVVGTVFTYQAGDEHVEITVMPDTKDILGVTCVVVHDQATVNGSVIEDTYDWFAQDSAGAVWYMGEDTKEFNTSGVVVSTEGSWEAGADDAKPGVIVPASPAVGDKYRQEYRACHAEDMGEILALDATADVAAGSYSGCLQTRDTTPLEPDVNEEKYYCPDVGIVLSVDVASGEREELLSVTPP